MFHRRIAALIAVIAAISLFSAAHRRAAPAAAASDGARSRRQRGGGCTVGVSWNNYQEERWAKWDEPAIKAAVAAGGGKYISNDAKSSAETQASNVENLISQGAKVADHPRPGRHGHQAVGRQARSRPASRSSPMTA